MDFPVDLLEVTSHGELERSAQTYMDKLLYADPDRPQHFTLTSGESVPVCLSNVGFVPLYGASVQHKVLALFTPQDQFTAVALFLADHWCSLEEILRTTNPTRQGLIKVRSVGERIVLYVLNRIVYRAKEMTEGEVPFLCHCENHFAKILWKDGEAVGFYSVKTKGSVCSNSLSQRYCLPVMDSIFVKKAYRGKCHGLQMLEDFVDSFDEAELGLKFPLSPAMANVCKHYLQRYPADVDLFWEVEGMGAPYQRTRVASRLASRAIERASVSTRSQSSEHRTSKRARDEELMVEVQPEKIRRIKGDNDLEEESRSSDGTAKDLEELEQVADQKEMSGGAEKENESLVRIVSVETEEEMQVEEAAALHVVKGGGDTADRTAENMKFTVSDEQDEEIFPADEDKQNEYHVAVVQRTHEGSNEEVDEEKPINETGSVVEKAQEMHPTVTKDKKKTPTKAKKVVKEKKLTSASVEYKEDSPAGVQETKDSPAVEKETKVSPSVEKGTKGSPSAKKETKGSPGGKNKTKGSPAAKKETKESPPAKKETKGSPVAKKETKGSPAAKKETKGKPEAKKETKNSPAEEEKTIDSPATEEETKDSPAMEEGTKDSPAAEEETKDSPAAEEETKDSPAAEEETKDNPAAEEETKDSPAAEKKTKDSLSAEKETKDSPLVENETKDNSSSENETKDNSSSENETKDILSAEKETKDSPSAENETKDSPAIEEETKNSPAIEEETKVSKNEEETELGPKTKVEKMKTPEAQKDNAKSPEDTEENKTCPPAEEEAILNSTSAEEEAHQPDLDLIKDVMDVEMLNVPEQLPEEMVQFSGTEDSIKLQLEDTEEEKAASNEASWNPVSLGTTTNMMPSTPTHTFKIPSTRTLVEEEGEQEAAMDHEKEWSGSNEVMEVDHSLVEEEEDEDEEGDDPPVVDRRVLRRKIKVTQGAARPRTKRRGRM